MQLEIPILYVKGSADRNSPVLQSDYIMLEFIRLGKDNLTYLTLPGVDHWLGESVKKEGKREHISHRGEVFDAIMNWAISN